MTQASKTARSLGPRKRSGPPLCRGSVLATEQNLPRTALYLPSGPTTHEDHQRASVRGHERAATGTILGFYSEHHQGVFTHRGANTHMHVVLPAKRLTGHVDHANVPADSTVRLPDVRAERHPPR